MERMNIFTASSPQALPLAWPLSDMGSGDVWQRPSTNVYDAKQITLPGDDTCGLSAPGVQCSVPSGCQWGRSSETLRNVGLQWRGGVREYNKTLYADKSGPHAVKNVSLSLTSVANEA